MNTRFAPFRLFVFVVLGVVAMGDLNHAADVELWNTIELHSKEGSAVESNQKNNLRAVGNQENGESIFSRWMRKLDTSCKPYVPPCDSLEKPTCKERPECVWRKLQDPPMCDERKPCKEVKKQKKCTKRHDCSWSLSSDVCVPKEE